MALNAMRHGRCILSGFGVRAGRMQDMIHTIATHSLIATSIVINHHSTCAPCTERLEPSR